MRFTMRFYVRTLLLLALVGAFLATPPVQAQKPLPQTARPSLTAAQRPVRVAVYYNPPLAGISDKGQAEGFFIDLLEYIAEREGWQVRYVFCPFSACLEMARAGQVDLVPVVAYSEERARTLAFNQETVVNNWGEVYTRRGLKVESLLDLNGLRVVAVRDGIYLAHLREMIPNLGISVEVLEVGSYHAVFEALQEKRADVGLVGRLVGEWELRRARYDVSRTPIIILPVSLRFAAPKEGAEDLLSTIDRYLVTLKADPNSAYYAMLDKHLGRLPSRRTPWWHWALALGAVMAAVAGGVSALLYRHRMVRREQALRASQAALEREATSRERAERALQEAEARYRLIFENMVDVVFLLDVDLCIRDISPSVRATFGYEPNELIGRCIGKGEFVIAEDLPRLLADAERTFRGEEQPSVVYRFRAKDGSIHYGEVTADRLILDGQVVALLGTIRDVTERIRMQEEAARLQQQMEQVRRLESIGLLVGGVAHDFNNMLTAILGHLDLALLDMPEDAPWRADLQEARASGDRAAQLARQLLIFSRNQPVKRVPLDMGQVVQDILKMLRRLIGEQITIRTEIAPDLWPIEGDALQLQQVVMNLAVNARDAMPQGGELTIRLENIALDEEYIRREPLARPGHFVRLTVTDTGTGMPPEVLEHIFEPFFTTKPKGEGTGLGLSTVYGIVRQHEGWINVYSEVGRGTTFHIYLPAVAEGVWAERSTRPAEAAPEGRGERILVVEDDEHVRRFAVSTLEAHGYHVGAAGSIREALTLFAQNERAWDAIFADFILPDGTGLDLLTAVRAKRPEIPVLLASGWAGQMVSAQEKGYLFLQKPYGVTDLLKAIREVLTSPSSAP